MFGNGGAALGESLSDDAGGELFAAEDLQNLPSGRVGEGGEDVVRYIFHNDYVTVSEHKWPELEFFVLETYRC